VEVDGKHNGDDSEMSGTKLNIIGGIVNVIFTLLFYFVVPNLLASALSQLVSGLSLGQLMTVSLTSTIVILIVISFCRGAFPRHSVIWALAGIAGSLFSAAFIYLLLNTPAYYDLVVGSQSITLGFDVSLFGLLVAAVIALNSISHLIELSNARRKKTEKDRLHVTEIAA
jgi:tellurite resistance protein TehA-like permease